MYRQQNIDGLQLDDQTVFYEQVDSSIADDVPLELCVEPVLPLERYMPQGKLNRKRLLVDRLQISGTEDLVNLDCRTDDSIGERV